MGARCTNGHEIPPQGPGQQTNGRTVCRPCEDRGVRYRVVWESFSGASGICFRCTEEGAEDRNPESGMEEFVLCDGCWDEVLETVARDYLRREC
jgi:formylmethanofuran dehydrogenase subunit E